LEGKIRRENFGGNILGWNFGGEILEGNYILGKGGAVTREKTLYDQG